jgi:hypothetical protein
MAVELNHLKVMTHGTKTITDAGIKVLSANNRRLYAEIINSSDKGIWLILKDGGPAVVGTGIFVAPNGFSYQITPENMWRGDVYGITATGESATIGTIEGQ